MGEWVGEIKIWTDSGCQWCLYMLTSDLTTQKNSKPRALRLCDMCGI